MRGGRFPTYFDPNGVVITGDYYKELKSQEVDPYLIYKFEDSRTYLEVRHTETLHGARDIPKEHWKMFKVNVYNIVTKDIEGNLLDKPKRSIDADASGSFRTRVEADNFYQGFLAKYTECKFDSMTGQFVEEGNIFTPPDPDKPIIAETSPMASEFGSW